MPDSLRFIEQIWKNYCQLVVSIPSSPDVFHHFLSSSSSSSSSSSLLKQSSSNDPIQSSIGNITQLNQCNHKLWNFRQSQSQQRPQQNNSYKCHLRIGVYPNEVYHTTHAQNGLNCTYICSAHIEIVHLIVHYLRCTITFHQAPSNVGGRLSSNSTWNGMLSLFDQHKVDFVPHFFHLTNDRDRIVASDFCMPQHALISMLSYPHSLDSTLEFNFNSISILCDAFKPLIWTLVAIAFVLYAWLNWCDLVVNNKKKNHHHHHHRHYLHHTNRISLVQHYFHTFALLLGQSNVQIVYNKKRQLQRQNPRHTHQWFLITIWLFASFIFRQLFSTDMTALLLSRSEYNFDFFDQLFDDSKGDNSDSSKKKHSQHHNGPSTSNQENHSHNNNNNNNRFYNRYQLQYQHLKKKILIDTDSSTYHALVKQYDSTIQFVAKKTLLSSEAAATIFNDHEYNESGDDLSKKKKRRRKIVPIKNITHEDTESMRTLLKLIEHRNTVLIIPQVQAERIVQYYSGIRFHVGKEKLSSTIGTYAIRHDAPVVMRKMLTHFLKRLFYNGIEKKIRESIPIDVFTVLRYGSHHFSRSLPLSSQPPPTETSSTKTVYKSNAAILADAQQASSDAAYQHKVRRRFVPFFILYLTGVCLSASMLLSEYIFYLMIDDTRLTLLLHQNFSHSRLWWWCKRRWSYSLDRFV